MNTKETKRGTAKRLSALALALVMLFMLLPVQVGAASGQTEISLMSMAIALWKKTNLSTPYVNCSTYSFATMNTVSGGTQPVVNYTVTLPNPADELTLTNTHEPLSFQDTDGYRRPCKVKYAVVGQQTTEDGTVKLEIDGATPPRGGNAYFSDAVFYEETVDSNGTVTSFENHLPTSALIYDGNTIPVGLTGGSGKICIVLLLGKPSVQDDGTTKYTYHSNYLPYWFEFVYEAQPANPTPALTKDLTYGGHLCAPGESLTLSVEATVESGCELNYQWYSGTDENNISTEIDGATKPSFNPPTSTPGITFYKVVVTGTADGVEPVSVHSAVARVVVREASSRGFSMDTFFGRPVEKLSGSDTVYYLKWSSYAETYSASPLAKGDLRMTGKLPDHVTIQDIWTGSAVDDFDMTSDRVTLTIDDDTGEFDLNIASSYGNNPEVMHCLEKCYYVKLSNNEVYTLVVDCDARAYETERSPRSVQLYDENEHTVLEDFTVANLQSIDTDTSVVRKSMASETPVVLRAQVQSGGDDITLGEVPTTKPISWNEGQNSWLMVNGERFPKTGYFSADAEDTQLLTSPAFSLKPGLNVIEVYTEAFSFNLITLKGYASSGITEYGYPYASGKPSTTPVTIAHPVVYLIDYEGSTATELPSEASNAELLPPVALRMGEYGSNMESCPISFDETTQQYTLRIPTRYKEETINVSRYNHCLLLSLRPAAAGARTEIIGANLASLVVGQVRSSVLLDIDALRSLGDNAGFAIRVIAPNGVTQKVHAVKLVYSSSTTTPDVTVTGPTLDTAFTGETYAYYLDYPNANADAGTMTVTLPAGSRATVNGTDYTSGSEIKLDPKEDFYRLTITAEDNYTVTSYYFVTRYTDTGVIPYQTVSDSSKALAKEMLSGWYDALEGSNKFGNYWRIFMAKATGNRDGSDYSFDNAYVKDPARHEMKQQTDWGACILEIIMLGYNPYDFPRYVNGKYVEHYNYVEGLLNCGDGAWANPVWYHMAAKAAGATMDGQGTPKLLALQTKFDLDIRSWAIASLAGCVETKDMVRYIDSLHDSHNTSGPYISLWTNQSFHGSTGGNTYTIGCVLSAIASGGADPDKQFAYDGHTPLQTIKDVLYVDGKFRPIGGSPALPKDMVIGLGDILHGSNVWARYALTEEKYNDLIAKARTEGFTTEADAMPPYAQTVDVGEAYYNLYDQVAKKLVARNDYSMRANVTFGMPHELFADEVKKMPAADDLKEENLDALTKLIQQYEALDESSRESLEKDNATQGTTKTYQKLVKAGLALKEKNTESAKKVEDIYDGINALPDTVTASNAEAAKAAARALREKINQLSDEEKALLDWTGDSVLEKLEKVENATPVAEITVSFTLYGDTLHTVTDDTDLHSYQFTPTDELAAWVPTTRFTVPANSTVHDVFDAAVGKYGLRYVENKDHNYVSSITSKDGVTLKEKDNTPDSGWMYTLNGKHPNLGLAEQTVENNDVIVWHWTDDYTIEQGSEHWSRSRVVEYVANLLDANADNANYAYGKLDFDLKANVNTFRNNRNTLRTVEEAIQAIKWTIPRDGANDYYPVRSWIEDKLGTAIAGRLQNTGANKEWELVMDVYDGVTPAKPGLDGSFTATVKLAKGDGDSRVKLEVAINGTIEHPISQSAAVKSVTVCGNAASASGNSYTVTVPYGSSVTAASFEIVPDDGASVTGPTEGDGVWKFTVTAEDGTTTEEYTVKVSVASKPAGGGTSGKPAKSNKDQQTAEPDDGLTFTDVRTGSWYYEAVQYAAENGLMTGTSASQFAPNADTTRGMIVTILARLEGEDTSGTPWYAAGRRWAMDAGVSDGTNMDGRITREQLAAMLYRYAKAKGCDVSASADISAYTDASGVSAWALDAMRWAVGAGLIGGRTATTLAPQGNATRAEVAAILMRFAQKIAN